RHYFPVSAEGPTARRSRVIHQFHLRKVLPALCIRQAVDLVAAPDDRSRQSESGPLPTDADLEFADAATRTHRARAFVPEIAALQRRVIANRTAAGARETEPGRLVCILAQAPGAQRQI